MWKEYIPRQPSHIKSNNSFQPNIEKRRFFEMSWEVLGDPLMNTANYSVVGVVEIMTKAARNEDSVLHYVISLTSTGIVTRWDTMKLETAFTGDNRPTYTHRVDLRQELMRCRSRKDDYWTKLQFTGISRCNWDENIFIVSTNTGEFLRIAVPAQRIRHRDIDSDTIYMHSREEDKKRKLAEHAMDQRSFICKTYCSFPPMETVTVQLNRSDEKKELPILKCMSAMFSHPCQLGIIWRPCIANGENKLLISSLDFHNNSKLPTTLPSSASTSNIYSKEPSTLIYCRSTKFSMSVPIGIAFAETGSKNIHMTDSISQYLVGQSISNHVLGKSFEIKFYFADNQEAIDASKFQPKLNMEQTYIIESVSREQITLTTPYLGPNVIEGFPKIHFSTQLLPYFGENSVPMATTALAKHLSARPRYGVATVVRELNFLSYTEIRVNAFCTHPELPIIIMGLSNDEIRIISIENNT